MVPLEQLNECLVNEETGMGRIEMGEWVYEGGVMGGRAEGVGRVLVAGLGEICGEWKDGIMVGYKFE